MSGPSASRAAETGIVSDVGLVQLLRGGSRKGLEAAASPAPWCGGCEGCACRQSPSEPAQLQGMGGPCTAPGEKWH